MVKSSTRPSDSGDSIKINVVQLSPNPPDGGWGWFVCLAAFYCNFIVIGLQMCFGLIYIGLRDTFYDSASKTSLSGALFSGFNMLIGKLYTQYYFICDNNMVFSCIVHFSISNDYSVE